MGIYQRSRASALRHIRGENHIIKVLRYKIVSLALQKRQIHMLIQEKEALLARIETALDDVRPHLAVDGGNVELVDVTDDMIVQIKWMGNCESCNMSAMTMRAGIEQSIRSKIPTIKSVEALNGITL